MGGAAAHPDHRRFEFLPNEEEFISSEEETSPP
jgi:hypothetical protein